MPYLDLVFPPRCPVCSDHIGAQTGLCMACWNSLEIPGANCCEHCAMRLPERGARQCAGCESYHNGVAAAALYNDIARDLVLKFKYGGRIALAPMLSRLISAQVARVVERCGPLDEEWLIIPVPLHWTRIWLRGYNQAALLARELVKIRGGVLIVDGLKRHKKTPPLAEFSADERARIVNGAISVNKPRAAQIAGRNVILVDDVLTSGATSNACIQALKEAGAGKVIIACFARVS